jgi:photosystem II stability/assembly factor-like uncharacterized protein
MRVRLLGLALLSVVAAGCGTSTPAVAGRQATSSAVGSATPADTVSAAPADTVSAAACSSAQATPVGAGTLTGMEFVSAAQGWVVGQNTILATSDGGAHWRAQLTGDLNLNSVDFISGRDGWAVGTTSLLATTDGGARWTPLPEPCQTIRSVHFISPTTGFAVAGGRDLSGPPSPGVPYLGGVVLATSDGGRSWHPLATPGNAQTVCFSDPVHGWLGADGMLYRTSDGGRTWTVLTSKAGQLGSDPASMTVECASEGAAWALSTGPGAAMSQEPHVGYHADQAGATPIFAEQYFRGPGTKPAAEAPGSYAGPYSALSPSAAVFVDFCVACGYGTAPWDVATDSGATLVREGNVGEVNDPQAASFLSPALGWVAGLAYASETASAKDQERIVATTDGGRTWHVEWTGPWTG